MNICDYMISNLHVSVFDSANVQFFNDAVASKYTGRFYIDFHIYTWTENVPHFEKLYHMESVRSKQTFVTAHSGCLYIFKMS